MKEDASDGKKKKKEEGEGSENFSFLTVDFLTRVYSVTGEITSSDQ